MPSVRQHRRCSSIVHVIIGGNASKSAYLPKRGMKRAFIGQEMPIIET